MVKFAGRRHRHSRAWIVLLLLALVAQAGWTVGAPGATSPAAKGLSPDAPRLLAPAGQTGQNGSGDVASQSPFEVGHSLINDVSPPLRDIKPLPPDPETWGKEMREVDPVGNEKEMAPVEDAALQPGFGLDSPMIPAPSRNFAGVGNRNGVYPPDTNGDVGPNHYVQMVNLSFQIWNKAGTSVYGPANGNTIWSGFGGPCQTRNDGDPVVLYDPMADRWLLSQFTAANPYGECIAISTTGDPTGSYYRYFFQFSTTVFYDYPHLGVWPDGYYMGANRFSSISYLGGAAVVFDRAKMLLGQPATYQAFNISSTYGTPFPSDLDGSNLPPAGSPNFFMARGTNTLYLWKFRVNWTTPSSSTFTGPTSLATAAYNRLCSSTRSCIPQPGTTVRLDGIGDRLMHRLAYRNRGTHESLVVNHSVNAASSGTQAGVRWYEVRNPNGTATIHQQGTYAPDANNRWMGSVAMDRDGNMAMVYSVSSGSVYPSIRYTGRLASDPLGTMPQGEATLIAGSGSQTGSASRWGDYAMMAVDPSDDCTFWFTTEYMASTGTNPWSTRIGAFKFPSCGSGAATATPTRTFTPPPAATNTPTRTNTPQPGATNTFTPTRTNTPPPVPTNTPTRTPTPTGGCGEFMANGGFESGTSPWVQSSSGGYQLIDGTRPRTGTRSAYLAGYNNGVDQIYQTVTIPANATSATWRFWYNVTTQEACCTPYDYLYAQVRNTSGTLLATLQTVNNSAPQNQWLQSSLNVFAYRGQTIRLHFRATNDVSLPTSFFVDDVSLSVCQ